jgi:hypothetical protein
MSRNLRAADATYEVRSFGNLALTPAFESAPQFAVIEGGRSSAVRHSQKVERMQCDAQPSSMQLRHAIIGVVAALLVSMLLIGGSVISDYLSRSASNKLVADVATTHVVVHEGDSLWALAQQHPLDGLSTRDVVNWIKDENSLSSSLIMTGQQLVVPDSQA